VGKLSFMVMPCYTGDIDEGQKLLDQLRALATPLFELVAPMPYPAIYGFTEEGTHRSREHSYSQFLDEMQDEVIQACIDAMSQAAPMSFIQFRTLGGAMARVPIDATAFAHRNSNYLVAIVGTFAEDSEAEATARWSGDLFAKIRPYGNGTYVNFLQYDSDRLGDAYPPATLARLAELKRRYDPENLFSQNQNIRPEA
jgi:FAD/FMN-containing dehydrogenase